jgi:hypothetical protein
MKSSIKGGSLGSAKKANLKNTFNSSGGGGRMSMKLGKNSRVSERLKK